VIFDRRLRTPPASRVFSTLASGPVIIMTSPEGRAAGAARARALEDAGAILVAGDEPGIAPMLRRLVTFDIQCILLEGGAALHAGAWDAGVVDYVQLYITPHVLGA